MWKAQLKQLIAHSDLVEEYIFELLGFFPVYLIGNGRLHKVYALWLIVLSLEVVVSRISPTVFLVLAHAFHP